MKKRLFFLFGAAIALLLLAGCPLPDQPASSPPEGTLSYEDLIASLDALQGPQSQSITEPGRTVFSFSGQASLSAQDLAAFIGAIKGEFAAYVRSSAGGSLYLVTPVKLTLPGSNSGLMWVPFTWWQRKSFPIISYQHGTQVYRECAPSRYNPNPLTVFSSPDQTGAMMSYVECVMAGLMASAGYIVVMPDYQGFGAAGRDPRVRNRSRRRALRSLRRDARPDALRIARQGPMVPSVYGIGVQLHASGYTGFRCTPRGLVAVPDDERQPVRRQPNERGGERHSAAHRDSAPDDQG
jgi:hypothetical protein